MLSKSQCCADLHLKSCSSQHSVSVMHSRTLTVNAASVNGYCSQVADKDSHSDGGRCQNWQVGCALSSGLVCSCKDHKNQQECQDCFYQPASALWQACQQPVGASFARTESCLESLHNTENSQQELCTMTAGSVEDKQLCTEVSQRRQNHIIHLHYVIQASAKQWGTIRQITCMQNATSRARSNDV